MFSIVWLKFWTVLSHLILTVMIFEIGLMNEWMIFCLFIHSWNCKERGWKLTLFTQKKMLVYASNVKVLKWVLVNYYYWVYACWNSEILLIAYRNSEICSYRSWNSDFDCMGSGIPNSDWITSGIPDSHPTVSGFPNPEPKVSAIPNLYLRIPESYQNPEFRYSFRRYCNTGMCVRGRAKWVGES